MRKNFIAAFFILALFFVWGASKVDKSSTESISKPEPKIAEQPIGKIGEGYFNLEVADTDAERTQGLSGREQLPDTDAMLFVFEAAGRQCFWMKEMKFNLDILWFDADKKLVYEKRDLSPSTYPESFCPNVPAKYVVEVTAGVAEKNQIKIGDLLDIEL